MGNIRPANLHTRRAALTLAAAATPAWSQSKAGRPVVHFEIGCRDRAKTAGFYTDLFGWHVAAGPASTIDTGGTGGISGHITSLGHEPHHYSIFYVEVDDVRAHLDKAAALGGKTLVPPIQIPTGTFAWLSDPDGNTVGLLKPAQAASQLAGAGAGRPVVHFEIGCRDRAKTAKFFTGLFGWNIQESGPASTIETGGKRGIPGHITALGHEPHNYTIFYVEVDDVKAYLNKAVGLGGKILVPPNEIPTGTFAWLSDPEGNTAGLIRPKQ